MPGLLVDVFAEPGGEDKDDLMPRTTSVITRAVTLRKTYTGEPLRVARSNINELNTALTTRHRPVPAAITPEQRDLEASVLLAVGEASRQLSGGASREPSGPRVSTYPFRYLTPMPDHLEVVPLAHALGPLAFGLVPRRNGPEIEGIPGLRAVPGRRGVTLILLDVSGHPIGARVLLKGVRREAWADAVAWADDQYLARQARRSFAHEPTLTSAEHRFILDHARFAAHPMLASAMLRRLHILSSACWVHVWTAHSDLKIEWCHGPWPRDIALLLADSHAGILGPEITMRRADQLDNDREFYAVTFQGPPLPDHCVRGRRANPRGH